MRKNLLALLLCCACTPSVKTPPAPAPERWAIYYDKALPASTFAEYSLVVFDRLYHPELKELKGKTILLAYISIGEVHGDVPEKEVLSEKKALRGKQEHWDSHVVDMSRSEWHEVVMAQIDDALDKGFDGVMLDTVDSPINLAQMESPQEGRAAENAAVELIQDIRERYPSIKIMLNRGFGILPRVAPALDYALAESALVQTDVSTGQSHMFPPNNYQSAVSKLKEARKIAPELKIYTLDYWNQDDVQGLHQIYAIHRAQGFNPYVSTPDLRRYTPEPVELTNHASNQSLVREDRDA